MSLFQKTKTNFYFISLLSLVDRAASFVLVVCMARYLGAEAYGLYAFAFSIASFVSIFADWGINGLLTRDFAANPQNQQSQLAIALGVKIPATVATLAVVFAALSLTPSSPQSTLVIVLMSASNLLRVLSTAFLAVFRAHLEMRYEAYAGIINRMMALAGGVMALVLGHGLVTVLWIFVIASVAEFIYSAVIVGRRFTKVSVKFDFKEQKQMLLSAAPFLLLVSFPVINYRLDSILLGVFDTKESIGIYNAAYVLILNFIAVQQIVGRVLLPVFSKFEAREKMVFEKYYKGAIKLLLVLAFFAVLAVNGFGERIVALIYGPGYLESVRCLQILVFAVAFMLASHVLSTALIALKQEKQVVKSWFATVVVNVVFNGALIPKYGYIGACIATVASEATLFFANYYYLVLSNRYSFFQISEWARMAIPFGIGLFFLAMTNGLSLMLAAPLLVLVYLLSLLAMRTFSRDEVYTLVRLIKP